MGDEARSSGSPNRTAHDRDPFATELLGLKRRGCCVLVTGHVNEQVRAAQSCRLFGQSDESRRRVLLLTDATPDHTSQYLPAGIPPTHSTVTTLDYTEEVRDLTDTDDPTSQPSSADTSSGESASMTGLGALLCDPVSDAVRTDSPSPGELRLGIATLGVLIDTDSLRATKAFVRRVRDDILAVNGMGHIHLPGSPDPETFSALCPMIDIHIELRKPNCVPEHRWHLLETGQSTGWLPMQL